MQLFGTDLLKTLWAHDDEMTSMRLCYVASTSLRRLVPAGNLALLALPPNILNLAPLPHPPPPTNILNLPTPMTDYTSLQWLSFKFLLLVIRI